MSKQFDVVVLGAGPGGYVAAIRAAQLGFKVACVDAMTRPDGSPTLGGTCLNVGCIPSKALLESSENYERALHKFAQHGIKFTGLSFDVGAMLERKQKIVNQLTDGIAFLFKKNKIDRFFGMGQLYAREGESWQVQVSNKAEVEVLLAKHVIIATGSSARRLPNFPVDDVNIVDNVGALSMTEVPKRLGVIGAGVIGLEMGSVWRRLGSEVTILEAVDGFLLAADEAVSREAYKTFTQHIGLDIHTGVKIEGATVQAGGGVSVRYTEKDGSAQTAEFDKLIVAVGRTPNAQGVADPALGLKLDDRGFIDVDAHCATNLPNVYAIGDVVRGPMLAHKSSEEGVMVAERLAGQATHVHFDTIPWVIYTAPEIAWVGKNEQQLKAAGIAYRKGQFSFTANGRAMGLGENAGFVKMLACAETDRILGVHIIGPFASELITEAVVAMEFAASSEDLARIVHAHPSLSEVVHEAALAVDKRALHG